MVFTSGEATAIYLKKQKEGAKVYLLGTPFLEEEFINAGFKLVKDKSEKPDFVVLGFDKPLHMKKYGLPVISFVKEYLLLLLILILTAPLKRESSCRIQDL
jgi:ribonucleotide monophosphatase NagD (HAD superfamily)